jgi:RHS repeat-associated protein
LLVTIAGSTTTYHHPDHLSNRAETNSSGTRIRTFGQLPFGETWYETGTADKWKFTGYERDSGTGETGLDYANFRYYSSAQGMFISADFLAGSLGAPQSLNRYSYTNGDPINLKDPLGLEPLTCAPGMTRIYNGNGPGYCVLDPEPQGSPDFGPPDKSGGGPARKRALDRLKNKKCLEWILQALAKAYEVGNNAVRATGYGISQDTKDAQKAQINETTFTNALSGAKVQKDPNPNPDYNAKVVGNTILLEGGWNGDSDKAGTMLHETFHLPAYGFSDETMAKALGADYKEGKTPQETANNASEAWSKKLEDSPCGNKK